ncbi:MAG: hypothetical protein M1423_01300, partial [Acidobacteria bacterium]|nr:hypothetical protein [Acidobacteriota bacterium]
VVEELPAAVVADGHHLMISATSGGDQRRPRESRRVADKPAAAACKDWRVALKTRSGLPAPHAALSDESGFRV